MANVGIVMHSKQHNTERDVGIMLIISISYERAEWLLAW